MAKSAKNLECFAQFQSACVEQGFVQRGDSFFRVIGDGVFQVLKYQYQRVGPHYSLDMGLFSMYGELQKSWFTSLGCIPRYSVMHLIGWRSTLRPNAIDSINNCNILPYDQWYVTPEEQLEVLLIKGFPFLDSIKTQKDLVEAMCYLDTVHWGGNVHWNDPLKLEPFLYSGESKNAIKVIDSILDQHCSAIQSWKEYFSPEQALQMQEEQEKNDQYFIAKRRMILEGNYQDIEEFLETNYKANCKHARFCMSNREC